MESGIVRGHRGVQQEEVWAAADAVLTKGERPTIERVRQFLGRGSPNTVGPMLDGWYALLAKRLISADAAADAPVPGKAGESPVPAPVMRAAQVLWGRALQQSRELAGQELRSERHELEMQEQALSKAQEALAAEWARLDERAEALTAALQAKDEQIAALGQQLESQRQRISTQASEMDSLRGQCNKLAAAIDQERQSLHIQEEESRKERERMEQRAVAQERRWLEEIDRARQDLKRITALHAEEATKTAAALAQEQERAQSLERQLLGVQAENQLLRVEMSAAKDDATASKNHALQLNASLTTLIQELRHKLEQDQALAAPNARLSRRRKRRTD